MRSRSVARNSVEAWIPAPAGVRPLRYVTVDPHAAKPHAACECWAAGAAWRVRLCRASTAELFWRLGELGKEWVVWVEEPYLHKNFRTAKALCIAVGEVKAVAEMSGHPLHLLNPAKWTAWAGLPKTSYAASVSNLLRVDVDEDMGAAYLMMMYLLSQEVGR